mgnify:CR=1 FL=1
MYPTRLCVPSPPCCLLLPSNLFREFLPSGHPSFLPSQCRAVAVAFSLTHAPMGAACSQIAECHTPGTAATAALAAATTATLHGMVESHAHQYFPFPKPAFASAYVDHCVAHRGVMSLSQSFVAEDDFRRLCQAVAPVVHRSHLMSGRPCASHRGVFFFILSTAREAKTFQQHLKGLETIAFLRLPGLVTPPAALVSYLGLQIACMATAKLQSPVSLGPGGSRHVDVSRIILMKVLRLRSEPSIMLYEGGDGTLVVVDASCLLPALCLPAAGTRPGTAKMVHAVRPEIFIMRDVNWAPAAAASFDAMTEPPPGSANLPTMRHSFLSLVVNAASTAKLRKPHVPTLNAMLPLLSPQEEVLSDRLAAAALPPTLPVPYINQPAQFNAPYSASLLGSALGHNIALTQAVVGPALRVAVELLETSIPPQDAAADVTGSAPLVGCDAVARILRECGIGLHMLGLVWASLSPHAIAARQLVASEIMSRAAKEWLRRRLLVACVTATSVHGDANNPSAAIHVSSEAIAGVTQTATAEALALFRGLPSPEFIDAELMPIALAKYGIQPASDAPSQPSYFLPPITHRDVVFRLTFDRAQALTGVTIAGGHIRAVAPCVRVARVWHQLTHAQEGAISATALRRDDVLAAAVVVAAAAVHAELPARLGKLAVQLRSRAPASAEARAGAGGGQQAALALLFIGALDMTLASVLVHGNVRQWNAAVVALERCFPELYGVCADGSGHDRLFVTRQSFRLIECYTRLHKSGEMAAITTELLHLEPLKDASQVGTVSGRMVVAQFHRLSIELCLSTGQLDNALIISQRWAKLSAALFGPLSSLATQAGKLLLVCLVRCRRRQEALQLSSDALSRCLAAYGAHDTKTATAMCDVASLVWRRCPREGLAMYQRALDIFRRTPAANRAVGTALYNMGLAATRSNRFRAAIDYFGKARQLAESWGNRPVMAMCDRSRFAVSGIAATKIQRWFRDHIYEVPRSQTTRTDLCSTITASDQRGPGAASGVFDEDDLRSTTDDIMRSHVPEDGELIDGAGDLTSDTGSEAAGSDR